MPHLEKILAHAERELAPRMSHPIGQLAERLPQYRKFLKIENHRLRLAHQAGGGGREICRRRVRTARRVPAPALRRRVPPLAIPADTDAPALTHAGHRRLRPRRTESAQRRGHPVPARLRPEEVPAADQRTHQAGALRAVGHRFQGRPRHALHPRGLRPRQRGQHLARRRSLEARFLAGPPRVVRRVPATLRGRLRHAGRKRDYLAWRQEDQRVRHLKYGPTVFLQEPNIKSSPGGLRDYHNLLWSLYFLERACNLAELFANSGSSTRANGARWNAPTISCCASARTCITSPGVPPTRSRSISRVRSPTASATRRKPRCAAARRSCGIITTTPARCR